MKLNFDLVYEDIYSLDGISKIDENFLSYLKQEDFNLFQKVMESREAKIESFTSEILIELSIKLEKFIALLFSIEKEVYSYIEARRYSKKLYATKRNFIQRYALKKYKKEDLNENEIIKNFKKIVGKRIVNIEEIDKFFISVLQQTEENSSQYEILAKYAAYRIFYGPSSALFSKPEKLDFTNLIKFSKDKNLIWIDSGKKEYFKYSNEYAYSESSYCINCHTSSKDSCRKGMLCKDEQKFEKNPLENILSGCPLGIKISEMNQVFSHGNLISALGIITIDNPVVALTGKRICNDCSKSCIFQKQEPVDIPSIESQILADALNLPYGFEIYSLLTMWQVLNPRDFLPKKFCDQSVLVVGMGPSGAALSHYLTRNGLKVVAIDGLKIEKLPQRIIESPVKNFSEIQDLYNQIKPQGFGGVAEYGITDRWDKVNLITTRLLLEKRKNFQLFGGIKFGANINYEQAKEMGFKHIALCCGSGYPNVPKIDNIDAIGVRTASDFLMSIGSGGMMSEDSKTNFMLKLPAIVIGGGLTAIDAASEIAKYYPLLAKKIYRKYYNQKIDNLSPREREQAEMLIESGKKYMEEDLASIHENRESDYKKITAEFGGITILYRKNIENSPSYRINHKELEDALNYGVKILENVDISKIETDKHGACDKIQLIKEGKTVFLPAKTILFATGSSPLSVVDATAENIEANDVWIFGDMDNNYSGSVVKAIASAKKGYERMIGRI